MFSARSARNWIAAGVKPANEGDVSAIGHLRWGPTLRARSPPRASSPSDPGRPRLRTPAIAGHDLDDPVSVEPVRGGPVAPRQGAGRQERVDDRLLDRLHGRLEERGDPDVVHHPDVDGHRGARPGRGLGAGKAAVAGREGDEDVARPGRGDAAHPGEPEAGPLGEPLALVRQQRSVRREDDDDRPGARRQRSAVRAAGLRQGVGRVPGARDLRLRDRLADRHAVDPEKLAGAVVRLDERADREPAGVRWDDARGCPDPALELVADHAGAAADRALRDRPAGRPRERRVEVLRLHVEPVDVVEDAVVGLPDDRQRPEVGMWAVGAHRVRQERVVDHPDRMRVRDRDRGGQEAGLANPLEAGQLAVAVEAVAAGEERLEEDLAIVGDHHRDAGADWPLADHARALPADERRVPDAHTGDVGDGVVRPRRQPAEDDPVVACAHVTPHGPPAACGLESTAAPERPRRRDADNPGHARAAGPGRRSRRRAASRPRRGGAGRRRRRVPRPPRAGAPRERAAWPGRALVVPRRGAGRRARGVRPGARPVRRRPGAPGAARRRPPTACCAAVRRRARRPPRVRPRAPPRAAAGAGGRRPGAARSSARPPRLGDRLGRARWPGVKSNSKPPLRKREASLLR